MAGLTIVLLLHEKGECCVGFLFQVFNVFLQLFNHLSRLLVNNLRLLVLSQH